MSAALDFRKCKRLLLSSLAVILVVGGSNPSYIVDKTKRTSIFACPFCLAEEEDSFNSRASEFTHISEAPAPWYGVRRQSRAHVAHFVFEITLLQAIMLTLLLVCSFSPKVQKYLLGSPYLIARESLFRSNKKPDKICRVFVAEEEGFEPPWAFTQTVFKTASL